MSATGPPRERRQYPPWSGPPANPMDATYKTNDAMPIAQRQANKTETTIAASYPFSNAQQSNPNLFPPVCIRTHWDPTMILRRTLPTQQVSTPLDPRPWTRVCMEYTTTQDFEDAPRPSDNVVFPSGGSVYPPTRYRESVDDESLLRGLDRPLGTCERDQYIPPRSGDMYRAGVTLPDRREPNSRFIQELSFPMAAIREGVYDCVAEAQAAAWSRSPMPFNNATKQARYAVARKDLVKQQFPQPMASEKVRLS